MTVIIFLNSKSLKNNMAESTYAVRRVENRKTEIDFPSSSGGTTTIIHPFLGPANYKTLFNPNNFQGDTRMPDGQTNADFVNAIYCGPEEFKNKPVVQEARSNMGSTWLYVPVVTVYTPRGFNVKGENRFGVYTIFDKNEQGRDLEFNPEELEEILRAGEKIDQKIILANGVGFAHRDTYQGGEHTPEEFAKNGLVIATYTPEGAKQLAKASTAFNNNPHTWIVDSPTEVVKGVSGLDVNNYWLDASGGYDEYSYWAFSFGVRR